MFGKYAAFIIPSYVITMLVMLALVVWIMLVYRARQGEIAKLEARGIRRGSARSSGQGEK